MTDTTSLYGSAPQQDVSTNNTTSLYGGAATVVPDASGNLIVRGDLTVLSGNIYTTSTIGNIFPNNATTINIGTAATTMSIGADTGTTTINNNLVADSVTAASGGTFGNITVGLAATPNRITTTTGDLNLFPITGNIGLDVATNIIYNENNNRLNRPTINSTSGNTSGLRVQAPVSTTAAVATISAFNTTDLNNGKTFNFISSGSTTNPFTLQTTKYVSGSPTATNLPVTFADFTNIYATVNPAGPTNSIDLTTKTYVDSAISGAIGVVNQLTNGSYTLKLNADGTVSFPNYKFPVADGTANQVLKTNGTGTLSWYTPSDLNTTYTYTASTATGGANLTLTGSDATTNTVKVASGTGITVAQNSSTQITVTNTGVTSAVAGTGISVNASTGAVTFTNTITALDNLTDVVITTPGAGQLLTYDGSNWINNNVIEFTNALNRPAFYNGTGSAGVQSGLATIKDTGASAWVSGDASGMLYGLDNNTTLPTAFGRIANVYDTGGVQQFQLQTSTSGVTTSGGTWDHTPIATSKNSTNINEGQLLVDLTNNRTDVKGKLRLLGSTSGQVGFSAPAVAGTQDYVLPTAYPGITGYVLSSTTGGVLSWVDNSATGTTYTYTASSVTGGANLTLTGSDATTNTVKLTNDGHITATYTSATAVTLGSDATDANTASTIVARDASGGFSAGSIVIADDKVIYASHGTYGPPDGTFTNVRVGLYGTNPSYAIGVENNHSWIQGNSGVKLYSGDNVPRLIANTSGVKINNAYTLPTADGTANQIIKTDGAGNLSFYSPSDLNTTYTYTASSATGGANLTLTGSDATTNTVKLTNAGHITATYTSATEVTLGSDATTTATASVLVARDANANTFANATFAGFTSVAASGSTITLTAASTPVYLVTGSGGQVIQLPNATTLPAGAIFSFNNNQSSGAITVNNNSASLIVSVPSGGYTTVVLLDNSTAAGSWDRHDQSPSNVSWSTNTFSYPGSYTSSTGSVTANSTTIGATARTVSTSSGDLTINTANGTNSGSLVITAGVNGNVTTTPNGSGSFALTLANGGNLTNTRNYVFGAIRDSTTQANGDIWSFTSGAGTGYRGVSVDNSALTSKRPAYLLRSYSGGASGPRSAFIYENSRGTAASPTALQLGDFLGEFNATGRTSTGWVSDLVTAAPGGFTFYAAENYVATTNVGAGYILSLQPTATTLTAAGASRISVIDASPQQIAIRADQLAIGQGKTAAFTATGCSVSGTTLTIGTLTSGSIAVGQCVQNSLSTWSATYIVANISGSGSGSTWTLSYTPTTASGLTVTGNAGIIGAPSGAATVDALTDLRLLTNKIKSSDGTTVITTASNKVSFAQPIAFPFYTATAANAITGALGWQIAISNSPTVGGRMAFWDTTNSRWSYISDNSAV